MKKRLLLFAGHARVREIFRFLLTGGLNTLFAYGLYLLFNLWMPYLWAYTLSYIISVISAYLMHAQWVFGASLSAKKAVGYYALYAVQFGINLGLLYVVVDLLGVDERLGPWLVLAVVVPLMYVSSRIIQVGRPKT